MSATEASREGEFFIRPFRVAEVDAELLRQLEYLQRAGVLAEFQHEQERLTVRRLWVEGENPQGYFEKSNQKQRFELSLELYPMILGKLRSLHADGYGHGALHPRNIIIGGDATEVVDALVNTIRLAPEKLDPDDVWLWGTRLPAGWSLKDWDRVSLLRTAALLAAGPAVWRHPLENDRALQLCREWTEKALGSLAEGDDLRRELESSVGRLDEVLEAIAEAIDVVPAPEFPVESELDDLRATRKGDRVLREKSEEGLRRRAREAGLQERQIETRFEVWIQQNGMRREAEVRQVAAEILECGLDSETGVVRGSACAAAERCFAFYGVPSGESVEAVESLLRSEGWQDERKLVQVCREYLDRQLPHEKIVLPTRGHVSQLASGVAKHSRIDEKVANRLVRLELERRILTSLGTSAG